MYKYNLIRSKRKTMCLSVLSDGTIEVKAPIFVSSKTIENFVVSHSAWIEKQIVLRHKKAEKTKNLTAKDIAELKKWAKVYLPERVEHFSSVMGLVPPNVKITSAEKRFGSCSSKGNICFSYRLMLYPKRAIDYVVVHELAHLKHHNHSREFYSLVEYYMPDYKALQKILREN